MVVVDRMHGGFDNMINKTQVVYQKHFKNIFKD